MYKGKKVSVVMPAYNEEDAIVQVINDFNKEFVDEVIVCDNNSTDGTVELAKQAGFASVSLGRNVLKVDTAAIVTAGFIKLHLVKHK